MIKNTAIFLTILLLSFLTSCQQEQNQQTSTDDNQPHGENMYYNCLETNIVINGKSTVEDNERGQWSVTFEGTLLCGDSPIPNAEVNVKFPMRNTDLSIKTKEKGDFVVKLSRVEENPRGLDFVVTLMGTKDATITKTFKVE
ncbi:MAG: hypothetical protein KDC73_01120 [Ignavibacteriae bacterium]|nr:hypothetical protein [Ignavibacteriota bacterium]MCB9243121.1 hypothetical protein [Ignavibacteriales bacterium]